jgi:hypothetical protein
MELSTLKETLDDIRPSDEDATESVKILMTKLGQLTQSELRLHGRDESEKLNEVRRDAFAGVVIAALEYAEQYDIDVDEAIDERMDRMNAAKKRQEQMSKAVDDDDAKQLADALSGSDNDTDDDHNERGVY